MTLNFQAIRIIKRSKRHGSLFWPSFSLVRNRCAATRAKLRSQPAPTFIGAMLVLGDLTEDIQAPFIKIGERGKGASESALAKLAVASDADYRIALHTISNRTAKASTFMRLVHT